jgi:hypothetical protein
MSTTARHRGLPRRLVRVLRTPALAALVACGAAPALRIGAQQDTALVYLNPDWSPDGTRLVFESGQDGHLSTFTVEIDGGLVRRLNRRRPQRRRTRWSPDGSITPTAAPDASTPGQPPGVRDGRRRLRSAPLHGRILCPGLRRGLVPGRDSARVPVGSGDRSRCSQPLGVHSLYVIGLDGMGIARVTDGRLEEGFRVSHTQFARTRVSPDGRALAYARTVSGVYGIHLHDLETETERLLVGGW